MTARVVRPRDVTARRPHEEAVARSAWLRLAVFSQIDATDDAHVAASSEGRTGPGRPDGPRAGAVSASDRRVLFMASTNCGWCKAFAHMEPASGLHRIADEFGYGMTTQAVYVCPNCHRLNMATQHSEETSGQGGVLPMAEAAEKAKWYGARWLPRPGENRDFPDVPGHIAEAASEAALCLSAGAYRAVGSLARAVLEATAKDKGANGKSLAERIHALSNAGHVRHHTKEVADEVRHFGNDMAHGDFVDPVTQQEAEEVLELMAEVLAEVYQSPARLARRRAAVQGGTV